MNIVSSIKSISNPIGTHNGRTAMQATFPKGNWGLNKGISGGMSWYGAGQTSSSDWNNAKEMTFGYSIYFTDDFAFNKGGKLPGLYFGTSEENARDCSGGDRDTDCASVRLMWRTDGKGELYSYLPPSEKANKAVCNVAPESECNDTYGASIGRGSFYFKAGSRTTIGQRVRLNDVGKENGEIELFVEGKSIFTVDGLVLRTASEGRIQGIQMQTFFGGAFCHYC